MLTTARLPERHLLSVFICLTPVLRKEKEERWDGEGGERGDRDGEHM